MKSRQKARFRAKRSIIWDRGGQMACVARINQEMDGELIIPYDPARPYRHAVVNPTLFPDMSGVVSADDVELVCFISTPETDATIPAPPPAPPRRADFVTVSDVVALAKIGLTRIREQAANGVHIWLGSVPTEAQLDEISTLVASFAGEVLLAPKPAPFGWDHV